GGKGEGAAGQAPVVALAMAGAAAGDGNAVAGQVVHDATGRRVVRLEAAPHVRAGPEQLPFRLLHDRHGVLRRAADRLAAVERRAMPAAVVSGYGGFEAFVNLPEMLRLDSWRLRHISTIQAAPRGAMRW